MSFAPGVIEELARLDFTSVRELQGAMNRLVAQQSLDGTLTPAQVRAVLGVGGAAEPSQPEPEPAPSLFGAPAADEFFSFVDQHRHRGRGADRAVEGARRRDGRVLDGRGLSHRGARAADGRASGAAELRGAAARLRPRGGAAPPARGEGLDGGSVARRQRAVSRSRAAAAKRRRSSSSALTGAVPPQGPQAGVRARDVRGERVEPDGGARRRRGDRRAGPALQPAVHRRPERHGQDAPAERDRQRARAPRRRHDRASRASARSSSSTS